ALIGTVHGLGVKLLRRFAFEAGVSPQVDILPDNERQAMFNQSLAAILDIELIEEMDALAERLSLGDPSEPWNWRWQVHQLVDVARANGFSGADLQASCQRSWDTFAAFLPKPSQRSLADVHRELNAQITATLSALEDGEDSTKVTQTAIDQLKAMQRDLGLRDALPWGQWAKLIKLKTGAKSRETVAPLQEFAEKHEALAAFQDDIRRVITLLFQTAERAIAEFDRYKKQRGLIDYTDMEVLVSELLDQAPVQQVLQEELDLLMVDEFQDTSPIQLAIFLKLTRLARHAVWVGDPKQSIYGFRGAEPRLMQTIIQAAGGIRSENIQTDSWRSREELVLLANGLFTKAFPDLPEAQVALDPVRKAAGTEHYLVEPAGMGAPIIHWHFMVDDDGRKPGKPWTEYALARTLHDWLADPPLIFDKAEKAFRPARPGDVAILCRSNRECIDMAEALHAAGLRAAISRAGLLGTAEARLVLACLQYVLNQEDSLAVAEIRYLATRSSLEEIVADRMAYLVEYQDTPRHRRPAWGEADSYIAHLDRLRAKMAEFSSAEILNLVLEELDLRRIIVRWGQSEQRLANLDELRRLALDYETTCNNTHTAASLGGLLLWLAALAARGEDTQGASEDPLAVNVLTYHRSKGLEWPVVACHSLEGRLRADLWGLDLVADQPEVDLDHVLAGRWLRYWITPYGRQSTGLPLLDRLQASEAQAEKKVQALAEEARLLYVGITRARDYLIFPTRLTEPTRWLNRVWHQGQEDLPTLDPHTHESPWHWRERFLDKLTHTWAHPRTFTEAIPAPEAVPFLSTRAGQAEHPAYAPTAAEWLADSGLSFQADQLTPYYSLPESPPEADLQAVAGARQCYLAADLPNLADDQRREIATGILARFGLPEETLTADQLLRQGRAFRQWW
ncbi:MAG: UvrD-helicase domain-containing protein, partial [Lewinella sp.]|nr:UvrD-helicase domain-containing protein [Lewinella sp.]